MRSRRLSPIAVLAFGIVLGLVAPQLACADDQAPSSSEKKVEVKGESASGAQTPVVVQKAPQPPKPPHQPPEPTYLSPIATPRPMRRIPLGDRQAGIPVSPPQPAALSSGSASGSAARSAVAYNPL